MFIINLKSCSIRASLISNTILHVKILLLKHKHSHNHLGTYSDLTKLSAAAILQDNSIIALLGREHKAAECKDDCSVNV